MKKILYFIFFTCFFLNCTAALASEGGEVILDLDAPGQEMHEITLESQINDVIEVGQYFDLNYPGNRINEDFIEDVRKFFPNAGLQELYDKQALIRDGVKFYRFFRDTYNSVKEKMLIPEEPPLVVADKDYDTGYKEEYIETAPDQLAVIEDFKKVLSYGPDSRDYKAFEQKYIKDHAKDMPKDKLDRFAMMVKKLDWKKLPFYGVIFEDPFSGKDGMGKWVEADGVKLRAITAGSKTGKNKNMRGAVHFSLKDGYAVLALPSGEFSKPKIDFSGSENLESASVFYPFPERQVGEGNSDLAVYTENFAIPVLFTMKDSAQPLKLNGAVKFTLCKTDGSGCQSMELKPGLILEPGDDFRSAVNNFVIQSFNNLPQTGSGDVELKEAVVDTEKDGGEVLRLIFKQSAPVAKFDVFIDDASHLAFERPRVAINGDDIIARLIPLQKDAKLEGKEFDVTVRYGSNDSFRTKITAKESSWFDFMQNKLTVGIILLGILGGFILNFMPCVFPVLSIKLISLTKFGARSGNKTSKNFLLTVGGIFASFFVIAALLSLLKYLGYSIGWGMQFQSPSFLVLMIFVITLFMAQIWGLFDFRIPDKLNRFLTKRDENDNLVHFLTGILIVLMATPCTAPYLATAIGFALSGSVMDIFVIMMAVAFGLSIPYFLLLFIADITIYLPKPGPWMNKLNNFMILMLLLTLVWLFSILYAQAGIAAAAWLFLFSFLFLAVVWFFNLLMRAIDLRPENEADKKRLRRFFRFIALSLCALLVLLSLWNTHRDFTERQEQELASKERVINYDEIAAYIRDDKIVIVSVGADWCLTCVYNDVSVFSKYRFKEMLRNEDVVMIDIDWTNYNAEVLDFMEKFGRKGLPFYVLFSKMIPDGMVLPEVLSETELLKIIRDIQGK